MSVPRTAEYYCLVGCSRTSYMGSREMSVALSQGFEAQIGCFGRLWNCTIIRTMSFLMWLTRWEDSRCPCFVKRDGRTVARPLLPQHQSWWAYQHVLPSRWSLLLSSWTWIVKSLFQTSNPWGRIRASFSGRSVPISQPCQQSFSGWAKDRESAMVLQIETHKLVIFLMLIRNYVGNANDGVTSKQDSCQILHIVWIIPESFIR